MVIPAIRYATTPDGVSIAYQVVGDGPADLLFVPGFASNLVWNWQLPSYAHFLRKLSSFCRLIIVDRRGFGISDRLSPEDVMAGSSDRVGHAAGSSRCLAVESQGE
jgi:pimeloyl-ACP methyl ester carboxylesterase